MATVTGTSGNDFIHVSGDGLTPPTGYTDQPEATDSDDTITPGSGDDIIHAGGGNDTIDFAAAFTAADSVDGGAGNDNVILNGDYFTAGVAFSATTMTNVETLTLGAGHSYALAIDDATVAAGQTLTVDGSALGAGDVVNFYGGRETDGNLVMLGGAIFGLGQGGNVIHAGDGDDIIYADSALLFHIPVFGAQTQGHLTASDSIDGGAGFDTVSLIGNYDLTFDASTITNVEKLVLYGGGFLNHNSYHLVMNDGNVAAGQTLIIDASRMGVLDTLSFDGSAETDGNFNVLAGGGVAGGPNCEIKTGAGNDTVQFLAGTVDAGAGDDTVILGTQIIVDRTLVTEAGTYLDDSLHGGAGTDTLHILGAKLEMAHFSAASSGFELLSGQNWVTGDDNSNNLDFSGFGRTALSDQLNVSGEGGDDTLTAWNYGSTMDGGNGNDTLIGGAGIDVLTGGAGGDTLHGGGGNDTLYAESANGTTHDAAGSVNMLYGEDGNDLLYSGAGDDTLNGGAGIDTANYSSATGGVTVSLSVTSAQAVGGGAGNDTLISIENVTGSFYDDTLIGNALDNKLDGSDGNDTLYLNNGGNDVGLGGNGNDRFFLGAAFTAADRLYGGDGNDTLWLNGDYAGANAVVFTPTTITNIENINLIGGHSYSLTTNDANLFPGQTLTVDGRGLTTTDALMFDGSQETAAKFVLYGGAGNDVLIGGAGNDVFVGGAGNDTITGGMGADHLTGGLGSDTLVYASAAQSTGPNYDTVSGFDFAGGDKFDLNVAVSAIDKKIAGGALSTASFDSDLSTAVDSAHLGTHDAVLFTPDSGDLAGKRFLIIDANGAAGYQAGQDYVIQLDHAAHLSGIDVTDFI